MASELNETKTHSITVMYWNSRTLINKKSELILSMESLLTDNINVHIYCISECRLTDDIFNNHFSSFHPSYNSLYFPSHDHNNGGLLFLIHKTLSYSPRPDLSLFKTEMTSHSTDIQWISVSYRTEQNEHFLVGSVYINPATTKHKHLQPIFDSIVRAQSTEIPYVFGGDFNAYHRTWNYSPNGARNYQENRIGNYLFHCQFELNLTLLNTAYSMEPEPTRLDSRSVLDLIFISEFSLSKHFEVIESSKFPASDHSPVMCTISSSEPQEYNAFEIPRKLWRSSEADEDTWKKFQAQLNNLLISNRVMEYIDELYNKFERHGEDERKFRDDNNNPQDIINELWEKIYSCVMETAKEAIGIKIIKPNHKFWYVNSEVQHLLKIKRKNRDKFLHAKLNLKENLKKHTSSYERLDEQSRILSKRTLENFKRKMKNSKTLMKESANEFHNCITKLRINGWNKLIDQLHDPEERNRVQWKIFKRTMGIKFSDISHIKNKQGKLPRNTKESLDNLGEYFSSISTQQSIPSSELVSLISHSTSFEFVSLLLQQPNNPFFENSDNNAHHVFNNDPVSLADVTKFCSHIPTDTALGWDFFSPHFLKHGTDLLFMCIHKFLDFSFKLGKLPLDWLRSNICSLYKSGDKYLPENYRPISLTPIILRLYERLLIPKVWGILNDKKILSPFQAGFRKEHGTLDNLYWLIQRLNAKFMRRPSLITKPYLPIVFLDLKKAFDKINIFVTIRKLYECGIRGNLLHFFVAFLTNRFIRAVKFDETGSWFSIDTGTPQGSVLGPIIFSIYINDLIIQLANLNNGIQPFGYADDIGLVPVCVLDSLDTVIIQIQNSLDVCSVWAKANFMTFSKDKSNILCFRNTMFLDPYISDKLSHFTLSAYQLEPFTMKMVDSYKYLGIIFNSYVQKLFDYHWEEVLKQVQKRTHMVCRVVKSKSIPIMVAIQLVISMIRSKIGYSLSLISTTRKDIYSKLESLVVKPLKLVLGLPSSAPTLAVLAESGISTIEIWKDKLTFQLGHRISLLSPEHNSYDTFYNDDYSEDNVFNKSSRSYKSLFETLGSKIKKLESNSEWDIKDHRNLNSQSLKFKELQRSYTMWTKSNTASILQNLKPISLENKKRELYILHDKPHISRIRARFRFNRVRNNELLHRYKKSPTPECPFCHAPIESINHMLMECPEYSNERKILSDHLDQVIHGSVPISINILLGDYRSIPYINFSSLLEILNWTGKFIEFIVKTRNRIKI